MYSSSSTHTGIARTRSFLRRRPDLLIPAPAAPWTREHILIDEAFLRSLLHAIDASSESVDLETYIFKNDAVGHDCARALAEAARRGVRVRLMVDGIGSQGWEKAFGRDLLAAGVQYRVFHQLPWEKKNWSPASLFRVQCFVSAINKLNHRNHRKICIVDGKAAWVGSHNITADHLSAASGGGNWRDTGVCIEGPGVHELTQAFSRNWEKRKPLMRRKAVDTPETTGCVILNETRAQRRRNFRMLIRRFRFARSRIWITNSYFVPHRRLLSALHRAAQRGVDVRILVPLRSDVTIIPWVTSAFYHGLIRAGVRVFEYAPRILHAKSMIIDDWFLVGSSNLDLRSLLHNLEVDVVVTSPEACRTLEEQFQLDLANSNLVTMARVHARPFWERWLGRLALAFRSLL